MERHYTATTTSPLSRYSSASYPLNLATSTTSKRSSISTKSPGSSPRSPLLLSNIEPSELSLTTQDDPSLDLDFDLLFLHDDVTSKRPKLDRSKSTFTEGWDKTSPTNSRPTSSHTTRPPAGRRDWSTFHFSHYASGTGYGGAVGLRGKGRIAELYTKNKMETRK